MDVFARLARFTLHLADEHAVVGSVLSRTERDSKGRARNLGDFEVIRHRDPFGDYITRIEVRADVEGLDLADAAEVLGRALGVAATATRRELPIGYGYAL